jgi:hypothetical protein
MEAAKAQNWAVEPQGGKKIVEVCNNNTFPLYRPKSQLPKNTL